MKGTITQIIKKSDKRRRRDGTVDPGGYGFIRDERGEDRFFHARDYQGNFEELKVNDVIEFEPTIAGKSVGVRTGNGLRASQIRLA